MRGLRTASQCGNSQQSRIAHEGLSVWCIWMEIIIWILMSVFSNVQGPIQSFLNKPQHDVFNFQMLSTPSNPTSLIFSDAGTSVEILGLADLEILIFGDFAFVKYPFWIAFSGNTELYLAASAQGWHSNRFYGNWRRFGKRNYAKGEIK